MYSEINIRNGRKKTIMANGIENTEILNERPMYDIIKRYCENEAKNGLMLLDSPTGYGKTHEIIHYMYDASQKEANSGKKFYYITSLKKNLPYKELERIFQQNGKLDEYKNKVLFLNSNRETVFSCFEEKPQIINQIENSVFRETDEYKVLKKKYDTYKHVIEVKSKAKIELAKFLDISDSTKSFEYPPPQSRDFSRG